MKVFILLTIVGFLFIVIYFLREILSSGREKNDNTKTLYEVNLKEFAPIWLKYNKEFEKELQGGDLTLEVFIKSSTSEENKSKHQISKQQEIANDVNNADSATEVSDNKSLPDIDTITAFYTEVISPYEKQFKEQNAYEVLIEILKMLDKHGSVPSVVIDVKDNESIDLISVRDNLAQISLKEHVFAVTRAMVEQVRQNYSEPENFMPQAIIIALAHDIGKIPELRLSGAYNSYDHAIVSSNWLAEQFTGKDIFWAKQAITAVRDHH